METFFAFGHGCYFILLEKLLDNHLLDVALLNLLQQKVSASSKFWDNYSTFHLIPRKSGLELIFQWWNQLSQSSLLENNIG